MGSVRVAVAPIENEVWETALESVIDLTLTCVKWVHFDQVEHSGGNCYKENTADASAVQGHSPWWGVPRKLKDSWQSTSPAISHIKCSEYAKKVRRPTTFTGADRGCITHWSALTEGYRSTPFAPWLRHWIYRVRQIKRYHLSVLLVATKRICKIQRSYGRCKRHKARSGQWLLHCIHILGHRLLLYIAAKGSRYKWTLL